MYFEVVYYPNLLAQEEYQQHKQYLEKRFELGDFTITGLNETRLGLHPAYEYAFKWGQKERAVILVQKDHAMYRIIYDPYSPLNLQVLSTIEFME